MGLRMRWKRRKVRRIAMLPTIVTLANGVCGILAVLKIGDGINGQPGAYEWAAWLILIAMVFDVLDGRIARMTGTTSKFGGQLDSLCDLITFGVAPAFLVRAICMNASYAMFPERVVVVFAVVYAAGAAVRLARFNVEIAPDEKFHQEFAGLPSPAAAGVVASAVIPWTAFGNNVSDMMMKFMPLVLFALGLLMISRIRYTHLVNRFLRGFKPFATFVELATAVILIALLHEFALFIIFFSYMVTGPVFWVRDLLLGRRESAPVFRPTSPEPAKENDPGEGHD